MVLSALILTEMLEKRFDSFKTSKMIIKAPIIKILTAQTTAYYKLRQRADPTILAMFILALSMTIR